MIGIQGMMSKVLLWRQGEHTAPQVKERGGETEVSGKVTEEQKDVQREDTKVTLNCYTRLWGKSAVAKGLARFESMEVSEDPTLTPPQLLKLASRAQKYHRSNQKESAKDRRKRDAEGVRDAINEKYKNWDSNQADKTEKAQRQRDFYLLAGVKWPYARLWKKSEKAHQDENGCFMQGTEPSLQELTPKGFPEYQITQEIRNSKGLRLLILVPKDKDKGEPLILCRGTAKDKQRGARPGNMLDDLHGEIGLRSYSESRDKILDALRKVSEKHGPFTLLGHSLGGAVAAHIYADLCDEKIEEGVKKGSNRVHALIHFAAPGSGATAAAKVRKKANEASGKGKDLPPIEGYFHQRDWVWGFGGDFLPGTKPHFFGKKEKGSPLKLHSKPQLLSQYREDQDVSSSTSFSPRQRRWRKSCEKARRVFTKCFPRIQKHYEKEETWKEKTAEWKKVLKSEGSFPFYPVKKS